MTPGGGRPKRPHEARRRPEGALPARVAALPERTRERLSRPCPTCHALPWEPCVTRSGKHLGGVEGVHVERYRPKKRVGVLGLRERQWRTVECPRCGAPRRSACRTGTTHRARKDLADAVGMGRLSA